MEEWQVVLKKVDSLLQEVNNIYWWLIQVHLYYLAICKLKLGRIEIFLSGEYEGVIEKRVIEKHMLLS